MSRRPRTPVDEALLWALDWWTRHRADSVIDDDAGWEAEFHRWDEADALFGPELALELYTFLQRRGQFVCRREHDPRAEQARPSRAAAPVEVAGPGPGLDASPTSSADPPELVTVAEYAPRSPVPPAAPPASPRNGQQESSEVPDANERDTSWPEFVGSPPDELDTSWPEAVGSPPAPASGDAGALDTSWPEFVESPPDELDTSWPEFVGSPPAPATGDESERDTSWPALSYPSVARVTDDAPDAVPVAFPRLDRLVAELDQLQAHPDDAQPDGKTETPLDGSDTVAPTAADQEESVEAEPDLGEARDGNAEVEPDDASTVAPAAEQTDEAELAESGALEPEPDVSAPELDESVEPESELEASEVGESDGSEPDVSAPELDESVEPEPELEASEIAEPAQAEPESEPERAVEPESELDASEVAEPAQAEPELDEPEPEPDEEETEASPKGEPTVQESEPARRGNGAQEPAPAQPPMAAAPQRTPGLDPPRSPLDSRSVIDLTELPPRTPNLRANDLPPNRGAAGVGADLAEPPKQGPNPDAATSAPSYPPEIAEALDLLAAIGTELKASRPTEAAPSDGGAEAKDADPQNEGVQDEPAVEIADHLRFLVEAGGDPADTAVPASPPAPNDNDILPPTSVMAAHIPELVRSVQQGVPLQPEAQPAPVLELPDLEPVSVSQRRRGSLLMFGGCLCLVLAGFGGWMFMNRHAEQDVQVTAGQPVEELEEGAPDLLASTLPETDAGESDAHDTEAPAASAAEDAVGDSTGRSAGDDPPDVSLDETPPEISRIPSADAELSELPTDANRPIWDEAPVVTFTRCSDNRAIGYITNTFEQTATFDILIDFTNEPGAILPASLKVTVDPDVTAEVSAPFGAVIAGGVPIQCSGTVRSVDFP